MNVSGVNALYYGKVTKETRNKKANRPVMCYEFKFFTFSLDVYFYEMCIDLSSCSLYCWSKVIQINVFLKKIRIN